MSLYEFKQMSMESQREFSSAFERVTLLESRIEELEGEAAKKDERIEALEVELAEANERIDAFEERTP